MPLPVIADVFRCAVEWGAAGVVQNPDRAYNVMHVRSTSATPDDIGEQLTIAIGEMDGVLSAMPGSYAILSVTVTPLDGSSASVQHVPTAEVLGLGSGEYISQGCLVMSWHTAARGAQARGRTYFGPITESAQSSGLIGIDPAVLAGDADDFLASLSGGGITYVVASYTHSVARTVTNGTCHPFLFTQRKRQHMR